MNDDRLKWIIVGAFIALILSIFKDAGYRGFSTIINLLKRRTIRRKDRKESIFKSIAVIDPIIQNLKSKRPTSPWVYFDSLQRNTEFTERIKTYKNSLISKRHRAKFEPV
jgi:hypothetical protein